MISDLGLAAWPVSLLLAARYFLAPLAIWAGHQSDTHPILAAAYGLHLAWPADDADGAAASTAVGGLIAQGVRSPLGWSLAVISLLIYGTGTSISGAPYLALVMIAHLTSVAVKPWHHQFMLWSASPSCRWSTRV